MACFHPLNAFLRGDRSKGTVAVKFKPPGEAIKLPCGQCIGCRLDRSLQWAVRCMHEASLHAENSFITLTYDDDHLPSDGSLNKAHFQKFMKRLRKKFRGRFVRYFHCGEYGDKLSRPHYHACLFGLDFPDKELLFERKEIRTYTSEILNRLWKQGFCTVGEVTFESAAYVARYCVKKVNGERAKDHYERVDYVTGEVVSLQPEYTTMSRRPGIAAEWFDDFSSDVFPWDEVIVSGRPLKPPRYYEQRFQLEDPEAHALLKERRLQAAKDMAADNTPQRLRAREIVKHAQFSMLKRGYENEA